MCGFGCEFGSGVWVYGVSVPFFALCTWHFALCT
jgi:hypothetical protein